MTFNERVCGLYVENSHVFSFIYTTPRKHKTMSSTMTSTPSRQQQTLSDNSPNSIPATFVPPKSTAQAQLTLTNHSKAPFNRDASPRRPAEADEFITVREADVGESAKKILQNVKQEDEQDTVGGGGKKKAKLFGRRSNSQVSESGANEKMFAKMGIVISQSPAPMRSVIGRQSVDLTTVHRARPPMLSKAHSRTNTMPNIHNESVKDGRGADSPGRPRSYHVTASNLNPPRINVEDSATNSRGGSPTTVIEVRSNTPVNQEGYDVITMGDVSDGTIIQHVQPSPPISLKSEPAKRVSVHSEQTSSPDSGYGNTPGSEGTDSNSLHRRRKKSQQESLVGTAVDEGERIKATERGVLMTATIGESSAVNHDTTSDVRTRGSTSDSMYSMESSEPSPVLPTSNSRGHQPLKPVHSAPLELEVRRNGNTDNMDTLVAPGPIPVQTHPSQFQLHMSHTHGTNVLPYSHRTEPVNDRHDRRAHSVIPSLASLGEMRKLKDQPSSEDDLMKQRSSLIQRQQREMSPSRRRRKYRSGSHAFSKSAGLLVDDIIMFV